MGSLAGGGMGFFVRAFSRRNIFAIAVGVVLAGAPLIAFNFWLENLIDRQGEAEVGTTAKRVLCARRGPYQRDCWNTRCPCGARGQFL